MRYFFCHTKNQVESHRLHDNDESDIVQYTFYPDELIFLTDDLILEDINHPLNGHMFDPNNINEYFTEMPEKSVKEFYSYRTVESMQNTSNYLHYGNTYGERIGQNKIFKINHYVKTRYDRQAMPIFCVRLDKIEYPKDFIGDNLYRIFIGECPHKDETGKWVTYQKVPNFITEYLDDSEAINQEPNIPHIVRLVTDEKIEWDKNEVIEEHRKLYEVYSLLHYDLQFCTFSTYIKGLWNRIQQHIGHFHYVKGQNRNQFGYDSPKYKYRLEFVNHWEIGDRYIWFETEDWRRYLYFTKDHKLKIKYEKRQNEHCYGAC